MLNYTCLIVCFYVNFQNITFIWRIFSIFQQKYLSKFLPNLKKTKACTFTEAEQTHLALLSPQKIVKLFFSLTNCSFHLHGLWYLRELAESCSVHCPHPEHILLTRGQPVAYEPATQFKQTYEV